MKVMKAWKYVAINKRTNNIKRSYRPMEDSVYVPPRMWAQNDTIVRTYLSGVQRIHVLLMDMTKQK